MAEQVEERLAFLKGQVARLRQGVKEMREADAYSGAGLHSVNTVALADKAIADGIEYAITYIEKGQV